MADRALKSGGLVALMFTCPRPDCGALLLIDGNRPAMCTCGMVLRLAEMPSIRVTAIDARNAEGSETEANPGLLIPRAKLLVPREKGI